MTAASFFSSRLLPNQPRPRPHEDLLYCLVAPFDSAQGARAEGSLNSRSAPLMSFHWLLLAERSRSQRSRVRQAQPRSQSQYRSTDLNFSLWIGRAPSPQVRGVGKILVGLAIPFGSKTLRTHCIVSRSAGVNISGM
jgi:hypothetical protein